MLNKPEQLFVIMYTNQSTHTADHSWATGLQVQVDGTPIGSLCFANDPVLRCKQRTLVLPATICGIMKPIMLLGQLRIKGSFHRLSSLSLYCRI